MLCKNRITLIGFLGQYAEMRYTSNGTAYTRFSLATSVSWKREGNLRIQYTHGVAPGHQLEQAGPVGRQSAEGRLR